MTTWKNPYDKPVTSHQKKLISQYLKEHYPQCSHWTWSRNLRTGAITVSVRPLRIEIDVTKLIEQ